MLTAWDFERLNESKECITQRHLLGQLAKQLPDAPQESEIPEVGELDELETFVGSKNKIWIWTAVNHFTQGILAWVMGDHGKRLSHCGRLWQPGRVIFYVGYKVYPSFIEQGDQIISKTYMTRDENTRLRHYLARLHRKTLCYSKSEEMLRYSIRLLLPT